ncbi:uncharacterized MFS-type transporter C09D4.1-like [Planococcus citri]|uniref:uncharacterized MFS-type transporter C09D4.1-like n=1 Tax=Planococcus citri TaxID=170843 RepID=UPI0031F95969
MDSEKCKPFVKSGADDEKHDDNAFNVECKTYKKRWLILALFCMCSACNASHWIQYAIITNIVSRYYNVDSVLVDWTSIIFMATYIPLVFPASWVLQKKGLRVAVIMGAVLLAIGSWIKVFSAHRDRFDVAFTGQTIVSISQMFTLGAPARLAAVWFPHHQVSSATAIGVFGNQIGIAIGFLIPPMIVQESNDNHQIGKQFHMLYLGTAIASTVIFLLILMLFEAAPACPPSIAQKLAVIKKNRADEKSFYTSLKHLICNFDFDLLLTSYGFNIGAFYAYSTLLNQLITAHFPMGNEFAGRVGLTLIIGGVLGSLLWGIVLDKTQIYKGTTVLIYCLSTLGMAAFTYTLQQEWQAMVYVTSAFLGFFMNGYLTVGYEFGAELTYPESEATSSGLLNASGELCGVIAVLVAEIILKRFSALATNISLVIMLLIGLFLCLFIDGKKLKRLEASQQPDRSNSVL